MKHVLLAGIVLTAMIGSAGAHHSFARFYFEDRTITVSGQLVSFDYRNPHAWVHIEAADEGGVLRRYAAEWSNTNRLVRDDISKETLKAGDLVTITGSPGRDPLEYKIHLKRIERPADGWRWPTLRPNGGRR